MDTMLEQKLAFLTEADKMKTVLRRTLLLDGSRRENDAEHSWHIALMAMTLFGYAAPGVSLERVLKMTLVHDLVEVYAGDTFAYDEKGNEDKAERERDAADRLFGLLPEPEAAAFLALWEEFDAEDTPDALYACAIDRLQPLLSNYRTRGHTWKDGTVTSAMVLRRMNPIRRALPAVWPEVEHMVAEALRQGWLPR